MAGSSKASKARGAVARTRMRDHADWLTLLTGNKAQREQRAMVTAASKALEARLSDPVSQADLIDVAKRALNVRPDTHSWDHFMEAIVGYLGAEAGFGLIARLRDPAGVFARVNYSANVEAYLERFQGLFATEIEALWRHWMEDPRDWRTVRWDVYWDQITSRSVIEFTLIQYSGAETTVVATPESLARLAGAILSTVNRVQGPEPVRQELVDSLLKETNRLWDRLETSDSANDAGSAVDTVRK